MGRLAYSKFTLDAEYLPGQLRGGNASEDMSQVAGDIGAVDKRQLGIAGSTEGNLALVESPTPGPTPACSVARTGWRSRLRLRSNTVVSPETSEDPDVWEVDLFQEFGKLLLRQENPTNVVLGVHTIL